MACQRGTIGRSPPLAELLRAYAFPSNSDAGERLHDVLMRYTTTQWALMVRRARWPDLG
jgi:hypothetical protein